MSKKEEKSEEGRKIKSEKGKKSRQGTYGRCAARAPQCPRGLDPPLPPHPAGDRERERERERE